MEGMGFDAGNSGTTKKPKRMDQFKIREEQINNTKNFIAFYSNLAYLSGGSIVLSITYLGYLKNANLNEKVIANEWLLIASWVYFLLTLICSISRNDFHIEYLQIEPVKYLSLNDPKNLLSNAINKKQRMFARLGTFAKVCFFSGVLFLSLFAMKTGTHFF